MLNQIWVWTCASINELVLLEVIILLTHFATLQHIFLFTLQHLVLWLKFIVWNSLANHFLTQQGHVDGLVWDAATLDCFLRHLDLTLIILIPVIWIRRLLEKLVALGKRGSRWLSFLNINQLLLIFVEKGILIHDDSWRVLSRINCCVRRSRMRLLDLSTFGLNNNAIVINSVFYLLDILPFTNLIRIKVIQTLLLKDLVDGNILLPNLLVTLFSLLNDNLAATWFGACGLIWVSIILNIFSDHL